MIFLMSMAVILVVQLSTIYCAYILVQGPISALRALAAMVRFTRHFAIQPLQWKELV